MTTTAERIKQIKSRAATNGHDVEKWRPAAFERIPPRDRRPLEPVTPPHPLDLACRRPMPNAWRKIPDDYGSHRLLHRINSLEIRITARLISRCLGPDWQFEDESPGEAGITSSGATLRHLPSGAAIDLRHDWQSMGRLRASSGTRTQDGPSAITMSRERTPAAIAADIERRLISQGLIEAHQKAKAAQYERRQEYARRIHQMQRAATAFGVKIDHPYKWNSRGYPEAGRRGSVNLSSTYSDKLCICIETADTELAEAIGRLYHNWHARSKES